jgi:hypothetical protein
VTPSPSPSKPEELIPNAEGSDEMIAPRNIDLSSNEHNILVGKCRRTQSTRTADAAEARPTKKGLQCANSRYKPLKPAYLASFHRN